MFKKRSYQLLFLISILGLSAWLINVTGPKAMSLPSVAASKATAATNEQEPPGIPKDLTQTVPPSSANPGVLPSIGVWHAKGEYSVSMEFPNVPGPIDSFMYETDSEYIGARSPEPGRLEVWHRWTGQENVLLVAEVSTEQGAVEYQIRAQLDPASSSTLPLPDVIDELPSMGWNVHRAPAFAGDYPEFIERAFIFTDAGRTFFNDTERVLLSEYPADAPENNPIPWVQTYVKAGTTDIPGEIMGAPVNPHRFTTPVGGIVSLDGNYLTAVAGEGLSALGQMWYHCIHPAPTWLPTDAPPEQRRWRIKVYAMENNPNALQQRVENDFGEGSSGELQKTSFADPNMSTIGAWDGPNPILSVTYGDGSWDKHFFEIGNVLYEPNDSQGRYYKLFYSAKIDRDPPPGLVYEAHIGYAYSTDGQTWTKYGQPLIPDHYLEDPYVVKVDDVYYLYAEDGDADKPWVDTKIRRFHSTDLVTWVDDGISLSGIGNEKPVGSPAVWVEDGTWYMIYEGWADGIGGLVTSPDGMTWTRNPNNPVHDFDEVAPDVDIIVIDDIVKIDGVYYMSYHAGIVGEGWSARLTMSTDLVNWTDHPHNPIKFEVPAESNNEQFTDMMMYYDGQWKAVYTNVHIGDHIYAGYPLAADTTPPDVYLPHITASALNENDVRISWQHDDALLSNYTVQRGATPYFEAGETLGTVNGAPWQYDHSSALGDPNSNHFYRVEGTLAAGGGTVSNRVGEFDFEIVGGTAVSN